MKNFETTAILPRNSDADHLGMIFAFSKETQSWVQDVWYNIDTQKYSHWMETPVSPFEPVKSVPASYDDLSPSLQVAIAESGYIDGEGMTFLTDILLQAEEINEEVKQHPQYIKALEFVDKNPVWKDLMGDAEREVSAKWAYLIYLHVKNIVE